MFYKHNKKTLSFEKIKWYNYYSIITIVLILCVISFKFGISEGKQEKCYITEDQKVLIIHEHEEQFSPQELKSFLVDHNFKFPNLLFEQFRIESSNFKSPLFKNNHNLNGMKLSNSRVTTRSGEEGGYAYYNNWRDCLIDYALRQAPYIKYIETEEQYLQYLKDSKYAEDPDYIDKIRDATNKSKLNK